MSEQDNPFEILGVGADASLEEITAAWRTKARNLHPDRFPDVSADVAGSLNREMARVNEAYTRIKNDPDGMRLRFGSPAGAGSGWSSGASRGGGPDPDPVRRRPEGPVCDLCSSVNTRSFVFTRQVGMVFQRRVGTVKALLCRDCAQAIGRDFQSRTMTTGWWGLLSLPTNIFYLLRNTYSLFKAWRLEQPAPPPGFVTFPADPGRQVLLRPFSWVGPVVLAVWMIVGSATSDTEPVRREPSAPVVATPRWAPGWCVSGSESLVPVSCKAPNNGIILSRVTSPSLCEPAADTYVTVDYTTYLCIDGRP